MPYDYTMKPSQIDKEIIEEMMKGAGRVLDFKQDDMKALMLEARERESRGLEEAYLAMKKANEDKG